MSLFSVGYSHAPLLCANVRRARVLLFGYSIIADNRDGFQNGVHKMCIRDRGVTVVVVVADEGGIALLGDQTTAALSLIHISFASLDNPSIPLSLMMISILGFFCLPDIER